jgi:protein gp37
MSGNSKIEWTDKTWNPLRARIREDAVAIAEKKGYGSLVQILTATREDGSARVIPGKTWGYHCEAVSPGCSNCYASAMNGRTLPAWGTDLPYDRRSRDLVEVYLDEEELLKALKWKRPRKIFVCSMTDLFAEFVPDKLIRRVFAVMSAAHWHTFQILTKRADRMRILTPGKPLPNVWLGVSCEDQTTADERIPHLLRTEAAFRFVSYEPALGRVDFDSIVHRPPLDQWTKFRSALTGQDRLSSLPRIFVGPTLDWIIVGGESGPGARPFNIAWARNVVEQCKVAGVAVFVKQLGPRPYDSRASEAPFEWPEGRIGAVEAFPGAEKPFALAHLLKDRKGGFMAEWPEDLRVRQFPGKLEPR